MILDLVGGFKNIMWMWMILAVGEVTVSPIVHSTKLVLTSFYGMDYGASV